MVIEDKIRDEKLQYQIHREAEKIPVLSLDKTDKNILQVKTYCLLNEIE